MTGWAAVASSTPTIKSDFCGPVPDDCAGGIGVDRARTDVGVALGPTWAHLPGATPNTRPPSRQTAIIRPNTSRLSRRNAVPQGRRLGIRYGTQVTITGISQLV